MPKTQKLVLAALFASLIAVSTLFLKIPGATGYYHLGDGMVFLAALVLSPAWAFGAASVGSGLADVLGGWAQWAPWTFAIKGTAALLVSLLAGGSTWRALTALVAGALTIISGYALATWIMYGWAAVPAEIYGNLAQTGIGIVLALVLKTALKAPLQNLSRRAGVRGKH